MITRVTASILLCCALLNVHAQTYPDAPDARSAATQSVRGKPHASAFWTAHAALLAATVFDNEVTHQGLASHKCVEGNPDLSQRPSRSKLYAEGVSLDVVMTAFDYLLYRKLAHGSQYTGAAIGIGKHIHDGTQWFTEGCF
jgi:hypothetical protein